MSKKKPAARRRSSAKSGGSGLWSWLLLLGVAVGGIQVYEHRDSLLPQLKSTVASVSKPASSPQKSTPREVSTERAKTAPTQTAGLPSNGAPVPPRSIAMPAGAAAMQTTSATLPSPRPAVQNVSLGEKPAAFAFCGRSGLNNCVADGNTFWMKGVKMHLSGIEVPNTEQARCLEERQKGFTAKVRLRDMLNAGGFQVASTGSSSTLSRGGVSFADQLVREGLARRTGSPAQSWCG